MAEKNLVGRVLGVGISKTSDETIILLRFAKTYEQLILRRGSGLLSKRLTKDKYLHELENLPQPYEMYSKD